MAEKDTAEKLEAPQQPAPAAVAPVVPAEEVEARPAEAEPLPIWFFVGLILLVYGVIVLGSGLFGTQRATVLAETRPAIWWGATMCVGGAIFLFGGLRSHRRKS